MLRSADRAGAHGVRGDGAEQTMGGSQADLPAVHTSLREHAQMCIPSPRVGTEGMACVEALDGILRPLLCNGRAMGKSPLPASLCARAYPSDEALVFLSGIGAGSGGGAVWLLRGRQRPSVA